MFTQVTERPWEIDTRDLPIFILWLRSLKTPETLVFLLHLALFRLVGLWNEDYWNFSHFFYRISFCFRVYMPVTAKQIIHGKIRSRKKLLQKHQKTPETLGFLLHIRSRNAFNCHSKSKSLTGKANHSREKHFAHGKANSVTAKANSLTSNSIRSRQNQIAHGKNKSTQHAIFL